MEKDLRILEIRRKWIMRDTLEALYRILWSKIEKVNIEIKGLFEATTILHGDVHASV